MRRDGLRHPFTDGEVVMITTGNKDVDAISEWVGAVELLHQRWSAADLRCCWRVS